MEKLYGAKDIQERYGCSQGTARAYLRQMEHMEKPLRVRESALRTWEAQRTRKAGETYQGTNQGAKKKRRVIPLCPAGIAPQAGGHIISRVRPTAEELKKMKTL